MLQHLIAEKLDFKVPAKHIQVNSNRYTNSPSPQILFGDEPVITDGTPVNYAQYVQTSHFRWSVVPWNTLSGDQLNMHRINIYDDQLIFDMCPTECCS